jgi:hypothetical protein
MTEEDLMEGPLPYWAIARVDDEYVLGTHLPTRDGRRCGNAHIIDIVDDKQPLGTLEFWCLTDAGTELRLTASELRELFHDPEWVSDVERVKQRFGKKPEGVSS